MTKTEYMKILEERLCRFSQELQDEILEDYNRHFVEGEKLGKSEEEIIRELGNIDEMIRELTEMDADIGQDKDIEPGGEEQPGSADVEQSYSYVCGYRAVELDGNIADIVIEPSDDGRIYVEYKNNMSGKYQRLYRFYQREENGVFYAGVKARETQKKISFLGRTVTVSGSLFSGRDNSILLSVKIPAGLHGLSSYTTNGDIRVNGIRVDRFKGKTKSGDIEMEQTVSEKIDLSALSGDLALYDVKAREVKLTATSGDVKIQALKGENLYVMTSSGDIELTGNAELKEGELIAASGDIDAEGIVAEILSCTTASGDIEANAGRVLRCTSTSGDIDATASETAVQVDLTSTSGDVQLDMKQVRGMDANVNTTSGEICITWQGNRQSVGKGRHCYGDGSHKVNVSTVSGDIMIDGRGPKAG